MSTAVVTPEPTVRALVVRNILEATSREAVEAPLGTTTWELLRAVGLDKLPTENLRVLAGDALLSPACWDEPLPALPVVVLVVPRGPLLAPLIWAATQLGTLAAGIDFAVGVTGFAGTIGSVLATTGVAMLANLVTSALVKPPQSGALGGGLALHNSPTITGAKNQAYPYQPVWRVFGERWVTLPLAANTFTEIVGGDTYLRMLMTAGYGPLDFDEFRIGDTELKNFDAVELQYFDGEATWEVDVEAETREEIPELTLFKDDVDQEAVGVLFELPTNANSATEPSPYAVRSTAPNTAELSVDIDFPGGLYYRDRSSGLSGSLSVVFQVQVKPFGAPDNQYLPYALDVTGPLGIDERNQFNVFSPIFFIDTPDGSGSGVGFVAALNPVAGLFVVGETVTWSGGGVGTVTSVPLAVLVAIVKTAGPNPIVGTVLTGGTSGAVGTILVFTIPPGGVGSGQPIDRDGPWGAFRVYGKRIGSFSTGFVIRFPEPGQWTIRIRRVGTDLGGGQIRVSDATWSILRSIRELNLTTMPNVTLVALRIKATDQLSGVVDTFRAKVAAKFRPYLGVGEVGADPDGFGAYQRSRNNAWQYLHVMVGDESPNPLDLSRIDLARIQAWAAICEPTPGNYVFTFDHVKDYAATTKQMLQAIAVVARGSYTQRDGKHSVVLDVPKPAPNAMITPRNSQSYRGKMRVVDFPHALRVNFQNEEAENQTDEVIAYADGFDVNTATKFETLELVGVTRSTAAIAEGIYHHRVARARAVTHEVDVDVEYLFLERGDRVHFSHDSIVPGSKSGRIVAVGISAGTRTYVDIDEEVTLEPAKDYAARIRWLDGAGVVRFSLLDIVTPGVLTQTHRLTFETPVPDDANHAWSTGDLVDKFGESVEEQIDAIVIGVQPTEDFGATLQLARYGAEIFDETELPDIPPGVSAPLVPSPAPPEILDVNSIGDELVIGFKLATPTDGRALVVAVEAQYRTSSPRGSWSPITSIAPATGRASFFLDVDLYDVRLRSRAEPAFSAWVERLSISHTGTEFNASDYELANLEIKDRGTSTEWSGSDAELTWRLVVPGWDGVGPPAGFLAYRLSIENDDGTLRREVTLTDPRYSYSLERNQEDSLRLSSNLASLAARAIVITVIALDATGAQSRTLRRRFTNPAPPVVSLIWQATALGISAEYTPPVDADRNRLLIWSSPTQPVPLDDAHRVFAGTDRPAFVDTRTWTGPQYLRWAYTDFFSEDPALLNLSSELLIDPGELIGEDDINDGAVTDHEFWSQTTISASGDLTWVSDEVRIAELTVHIPAGKVAVVRVTGQARPATTPTGRNLVGLTTWLLTGGPGSATDALVATENVYMGNAASPEEWPGEFAMVNTYPAYWESPLGAEEIKTFALILYRIGSYDSFFLENLFFEVMVLKK